MSTFSHIFKKVRAEREQRRVFLTNTMRRVVSRLVEEGAIGDDELTIWREGKLDEPVSLSNRVIEQAMTFDGEAGRLLVGVVYDETPIRVGIALTIDAAGAITSLKFDEYEVPGPMTNDTKSTVVVQTFAQAVTAACVRVLGS